MVPTEHVIVTLSEDLTPVTRLPPPWLRTGGLVSLATALVIGLAVFRGVRPDLAVQLRQPSFIVAVAAAWATGAAATMAAFEVSLPDRSTLWACLPLPALALWVSGISYGCLGDWVAIPAGAPIMHDSVRCLETLIGTSVPLALVLWRMLGRARPMRPRRGAWLAALAIAAFADLAHLLIHMIGATALVLIMNLGVGAAIFGLGGLLGSWRLRS